MSTFKRPPKNRRQREDADEGGRGKKRRQPQAPTLNDYDDIMEGEPIEHVEDTRNSHDSNTPLNYRTIAAVDAEEKGEKFRTGDKARRFYEQALDLYQRAIALEQTYDAVYNQ